MAGQIYSGSGVVETRWHRPVSDLFGSRNNWSSQTIGEAVAINLSQNGLVFVTLGGNPSQSPRYLPWAVYGQPEPGQLLVSYLKSLRNRTEIKEIYPGDVPTIVWFPDPKDPYSAKCIEPHQSAKSGLTNTQPVFLRATLQIVKERPTEGIYHLLGWLPPFVTNFYMPQGNVFLSQPNNHSERPCSLTAIDLKRITK